METQITIEKGKYIGDYQSKLNAWIDGLPKESWSLIKAPTESGKSTAIKNYFNYAPHRKKVLLSPTQSLVLNLQEEGIKSGFGWEWLNENKRNQELLTTYDSLMHLENVDDVFIDEGHLLSGHASFRECLQTIIKAKNCRIILMSGTAEIIEHINDLHIINFTKQEPVKRSVNICGAKGFRSKSSIIGICEMAVREINEAKDWGASIDDLPIRMIRVNSKETIDDVYELFKDKIRVAKFYSDDANVLNASQDESITEELKKGKIRNIDLLLVTSIYDAGMSLDVDRNIDCYAISNHKDLMPNAIDMLQLVARVRQSSGYRMTLTILGTYGDEFLNESIIYLDDNPKAILNTMAFKYATYRNLMEEYYIGVIEHYGVKVKVIDSQPFNNINEKNYSSKERRITIAKNLKGFGLMYEELIEKAKEFNRRNEVETYTNGEKQFRGLNSEVQRIFNRIEDCLEYNIDLSLLMDDKFRGDKIERLSELVSTYKTSEDEDFLRIITELIDGIDNENSRVDLNGFNVLSKPLQSQIKTLGSLLYQPIKWSRKSFKLTPKGDLIKERKYLKMLNDKIQIIEDMKYCLESGFELIRVSNEVIKKNASKMCEPMPMNTTPVRASEIDFSYLDGVEPYNWNRNSLQAQMDRLIGNCNSVIKLDSKQVKLSI